MKKLFFAALVATVAVGGAYAQYTTTSGGTTSQFNCIQALTPTCSSFSPIYPVGSTTAVTDEEILDKNRVDNP